MFDLWRTHKEFLLAFVAFLGLTGLTTVILWRQSPAPEPPVSEIVDNSPHSDAPTGEVAGATTQGESDEITTNIIPPADTATASESLAASSELGGNTTTTETEESVEVNTASDSAQLITGYGSLSKDGKTVMYSLTFPENGGTVTGSGSGYCNGSAIGEFDADTGLIKGLLSGRCEGKDAEGEFSGVVRLSLGEATGTFKGATGELAHESTWEIQFTPVE